MPNIYHILTTEILLTAFVSTILVPSQIIFAEDIPHIDVPVVITEILPVAITDSGTTSHLPSKDGSMRSEDVTTDTGSITSSGYSATSSGTTILENIISSITPPIDTESITTTGSINDRESELDLSDPSLKMSSHPTDTHPEAQILVQFKTDIDGYIGQYQVDQVENTHDLKTTETISEQNIAVMEIDNPATIDMVSSMSIADSFVHTGSVDPVLEQAIDDKIEELKTDPRVEHVQRNFVYQTQATVNSGFPQLWALDNQGQSVNGITGTPDADIDYPEAITYAGNKIGSGVIVAVLDTGVAYRHPDLAPHMWDGANCLSDTGATLGGCIHGYDFTNNDLDPMDDMRHGTHVAGTIGGVSNSDGVTGVALNVQIMAVKVLSPYGGTTSDIIRGINFAAKNGARVINASLGIMRSTHTKSDFDYLMYGAIQDFPGLFVAAAGNSGMNSDGTYKSFPAGFGSDTVVSGETIIDRERAVLSGEDIIPALQNVISVGATDQNDNLASFSNYGTKSVQIAAPGVNIYSSVPIRSIVGAPELISYANGWTRKAGSSPNTWTTRPHAVVSGEVMDISSVLWADVRTPYVSGESSYIEKTIANPNRDVAKVLITTWCDTPSTDDQIDILLSNNGGLYSRVDWINEGFNYYEPSGRWLNIDGHTGAIAQYRVTANTDLYNATGSFDIRLKWVTDSVDTTESGIPNYGCFVKDIQIDRSISGGYDSYDGTSMASPHVAGAAALAWSYSPTASVQDIKNAILYGADDKPQLISQIYGGKRLNIIGILKALEHPTISLDKLTLSGESGVKIKVKTNPANMDASQYLSISKNADFQGASGYLGAAQTLAANGIISVQATENGYLLENTITRAELAMIAAKIGGYTPTGCQGNIFADVRSNLGDNCGYIEALAEAGIITTTTSTFRPSSVATHGEIYAILLSSIGEIASTDTGSNSNIITETGVLAQYARRAIELGCSISTPLDQYTSRGHMYGFAMCMGGLGDISQTQGYYLQQDGIGANQFEFTHLTPDTTYYFRMQSHGRLFSSPESPTYSFRIPRLIPQTGTGNVSSSGSVYLSGSTMSGVTYGTGVQTIILTESGASRATATIPLGGLTITSSGAWDGIIQSPIFISSATGITLGATSTRVQSIYMIGNETTSLILSGGLATISIRVSGTNGSTLPVYRSPDSSTPFTQIAICIVTGETCTFTTDHFSLFAVGAPLVPIVIPPTSGGSSSGPGGGGGGNSSVSFLSPVTASLTLGVPAKTGVTIQQLQVPVLIPARLTTSSITKFLKNIDLSLSSESIFDQQILPLIMQIRSDKNSIETRKIEYAVILRSMEQQKRQVRGNTGKYHTYISLEQATLRNYIDFLRGQR